jgi:hypothetical protein
MRPSLAATCLAVTLVSWPATAQQPATGGARSGIDSAMHLIENVGLSKDGVRDAVRRLLADPEVLNSLLEAAVEGHRRPPLLKSLKVRFATFEAAESESRGLGLNYSYSYSVKRQDFSTSVASATGLDLRLNANGNVAFDRKINPRDFLKSDLALSFFMSRGGANATTPETQARLADLRNVLAKFETEAELERSSEMAEYVRLVSGSLTTQTVLDLTGNSGLESDQSFQRKSYVYGGRVGLDIKAWNPGSRLAQWNVFDWPFAALRRLNGTDSTFAPLGSTIPTVLAGIALVDPQDDDGREAFGALDAYPRLNLEGAFRTLALDGPTGPIYFQSGVRWYHEINAPAGIRQAKLHTFSYVALALVSDQGPYVSYSKGRLPFDLRKDEVYELGFKMYF